MKFCLQFTACVLKICLQCTACVLMYCLCTDVLLAMYCLQAFIISYGQIQSWTPQLVLQPLRQSPANKYVELLWNGVLITCPTLLAAIILGSDVFTGHELSGMIAVLVVGLAFYCFVFAVNSSVHSYLIVRYSEGDKVAMNVGFYYCANAIGRLTGGLRIAVFALGEGRKVRLVACEFPCAESFPVHANITSPPVRQQGSHNYISFGSDDDQQAET